MYDSKKSDDRDLEGWAKLIVKLARELKFEITHFNPESGAERVLRHYRLRELAIELYFRSQILEARIQEHLKTKTKIDLEILDPDSTEELIEVDDNEEVIERMQEITQEEFDQSD